jgi:flagellum-specific ATP synthase
MMGAYRAGSDPMLDEALRRSSAIDAFLTQPRGAAESLAASQAALLGLWEPQGD